MTAHRRLGVGLSLILATAWLGIARTQGTRSALEGYVASHQRAIVSELVELLSIPNVAADTEPTYPNPKTEMFIRALHDRPE